MFKRSFTKIEYSNGDKIASWQTTSRIEMILSGCHIEVQNKRRRCTSYLGYARCGLGCLYGAVSQTVLGARLCRRLSWYQALLRMSSCKLEACRDMASSKYGIKDIGDNIACQRARVSDVLRFNFIWAWNLVRIKALNGFLDFIPCCSFKKGQVLYIKLIGVVLVRSNFKKKKVPLDFYGRFCFWL